MVNVSTIIAVCVTLFISLVLPVIAYIMYGVKNKAKGVWTAWLLGAAGFFVMQYLIRTPIIALLPAIPGFMEFVEEYYVVYCLVLAFSAGLFEMIGRFVVAKFLDESISFKRGFAAGMGHGSIESMLLIGMTYINNLLYIIAINSGGYDTLIGQAAAAGQDTSSLYAVRDALISTGAGVFYLAGYERILTMILHIALSLVVCYFVWKKKTVWGVLICVVVHTVVDFTAGVLNGLSTEYMGNVVTQEIGYVLIYVFLTLVAIGSAVVIYRIRKQWKEETV